VARKPKTLTREQLQSRKDKAVRFTRDVVGDPERAEEIEGESLDDYAERRKIQLSNPRRRQTMARKTIEDYRDEVKDLKDQIRDLEDENQTLNDKLDNVADALEPEEVVDEEEDEDGENGDEDDSEGD
jgi:predicted RNase H-like nuclease (RuvC/YqgF family)